MYRSSEAKQHSVLFEMLKASVVSLIITLVLILVAAFAIKLFNVPTGAIGIINQVIKGIAILLGCLISFRRPDNGWVRGLAFGVFYILLAYLVFSLLNGGFEFGISLLNDVALGAVTGLVSGILSVNFRK